MRRAREIEFDLLRSLIILSAFILHFHGKFYIGFLALPSKITSNYIFTIGGFFFFTSGYMAQRVYLNSFLKNSKKISKRLILKGANILIIYLTYVASVHVFTDTPFPNSVMAFIYDHHFFTKVLFTFSLLFIFTPAILYLIDNFPKIIIVVTLLLISILILYNESWPIPYSAKKILIDRRLFLYPLLPSLVPYAAGFVFSYFDSNKENNLPTSKMVFLISIMIILHLLAVREIEVYAQIVTNRNYFTFVEALTPICLILLIRYFCSKQYIYRYISSPYILCIGILTLQFYVISNLFICLLTISRDSGLIIKILSLLGVGCLSYLFTFWKFRAMYDMSSLTRRPF